MYYRADLNSTPLTFMPLQIESSRYFSYDPYKQGYRKEGTMSLLLKCVETTKI
jgi:hypothetical protein